MEIFLKSFFVGFINTAPFGPIGSFKLRRALNGSKRTGILTGLGSGLANAIFALAIIFGLKGLDRLLAEMEHQILFRVIAGLFLIYLGVTHYLRPSTDTKFVDKFSGHHTVFVTAFLFTISNPSTFFAISSFFAVAGLLKHPVNANTLSQSAFGIFFGAFSMWAMITLILWRVRKTGGAKTLSVINHITSFVIGVCGVVVLLSCLIWN